MQVHMQTVCEMTMMHATPSQLRLDPKGRWFEVGEERWRIPNTSRPLKFKYPSHQALRVFVFTRDGFQCKHCGATPLVVPIPYDGKYAPVIPKRQWLVLDHIRPRLAGGSAHPDNLQTLCDPCNSRKGSVAA